MSESPPPEQGLPPGTAPLAVPESQPHPVRLVVNDDLRRSRLTVLFRYILVLPHLIGLYLWIVAVNSLLMFINWLVTLFAGRTPEDLHLFIVRFIRYRTHLSAYLTLLANPYPTFFGREGAYPVDLEVADRSRQNRWITGFRIILAIPAFVLAYVFFFVTFFMALIGWFVALAIGRMPKGMRDVIAYCRRYRSQFDAYIYLLTDRYPSLAGPKA